MKLSGRIGKWKRIFAAATIILLTACVEIGFNRPAILDGYEELNLSQYMETEGTGEDQSYVIEYRPSEELFVKQLKICGIFSTGDYTVKCIIRNDFDQEEEYSVTDTVHPWFTEFYTNINKQITSIRITLPGSCCSEIWSVSVSDQVEINKYRVVLVCLVLILLYIIFFEPAFRKKTEYFFLLFSLSFGGFLLLSGQPRCNAWDEQTHFQNAYLLASGRTVEWNEAAEWMKAAKTVKCNTKAEYAQLRKVMDEKGKNITAVEKNGNMGITHASVGYLPSAIFLKIGMCMGLPFSELVLFGRMGNLLAYILVMFWAIRLAKRKKLFLFFVAMMPTPLFLACSYTYDSVVFSFVTLGVVLWANEMFSEKTRYRKGPFILSLFLILAGGVTKIVYVPLVVIWLMAPWIKQIGKKKKMAAGVGVLTVCAILGVIVVSYWLLPILNGNRFFADMRGGETDLAAQLFSMLRHPLASVKMLVRDIFSLDNFRNSGIAAYNNFFAGNLMFLNYYLLGVMGDKWCIILIPIMTVLLLYREEGMENQRMMGRKQQVFMIMVLLLVIGIIWISMYLVFTPVGSTQIAGVQARYYLPLVYFAALLIQNRKISITADGEGMAKMTMTAALVLEAVSLYEFMQKGRLF